MDHQCDAHGEFLVAVATLSADVRSMRGMFKWTISAMLSISLVLMGIAGTFAYKASDLATQVQVNKTKITIHHGSP